MKTSLSTLRSQVIYMFFNGPLPDDSKLTYSFFDRMIIDARAEAIVSFYATSREHVDESLFSEVSLSVSQTNGLFWAEVPKLVTLENRKNVRVRGTNEKQSTIEYYEIISPKRMETIKNNSFDNKKVKAAIVGNRIKFLTKNILKDVVLEGIVYNPTELPNFDENAEFPISAKIINLIKEIVRKRDLNYYLSGEQDNENNSLPSFQKQAPAQEPQQ